jgi:solute carrier family 6 GABA transporter-like protein 1
MLRHDLNTVIGVGKNWSLPFVWAPMLRYISGPILAIIFSLAYPSFDEVSNDPLYIIGFIVAHCLLLWIVIGFIFPRWYDIFIKHERREDWKQPYAPNQLRGTTDGQEVGNTEAAMSQDAGMSSETSSKK